MGRIANSYRTTMGKKTVAAVTGLVLFGFLVLHMIGNLKGFLPPNAAGEPDIDVYAHFLTIMGEPLIPDMAVLWTVRVVLLVALVLHVTSVVQLAQHNRAARPVGYRHHTHVAATGAARWMLFTGGFVLFFLVIHLLQFTAGTLQLGSDTPLVAGCVYSNLYYAFQHWWILGFYGLAMTMVGLHAFHGVWSAFQTLGLDNPDRNRGLRGLARAASVLLFVAFLSLPTLMHFELVDHPNAYSESCLEAGGPPE